MRKERKGREKEMRKGEVVHGECGHVREERVKYIHGRR